MKPLVSILIPAFNAEEWIVDTLRSAVGQTWPEKEIIVIDDGSTDRTLQIARQFASKDVSVVTQENRGAAATRNRAFSLCHGDYIQWLDADDLLAPDKVARQVQKAEKLQNRFLLLSSAWGSFMHRPARARFSSSPLWCDLSPVEWLVRKWETNVHMQTATWLTSRELLEKAGPWNTELLGDDDGEYFFRVVRASQGVRFVPEARMFYRVTGASRLSHIGRSEKKMNAQFLGMKMQINYLRGMEDSERVRAACVNYLRTWLIHFYANRPDIVAEAQALATELGAQLGVPRLSWKYAWIRRLFGWGAARQAQLRYNRLKSELLRAWDKTMFRLEHRAVPPI